MRDADTSGIKISGFELRRQRRDHDFEDYDSSFWSMWYGGGKHGHGGGKRGSDGQAGRSFGERDGSSSFRVQSSTSNRVS